MANVTALYQLKCGQSFDRDGGQEGLRVLAQTAARFQAFPDNLKLVSAAAGAKADLQTGATKIYRISVQTQTGSNASVFLQVFNTAQGSVTLGTTPPDFAVGPILAGATMTVDIPQGITFGTNASYACTTLASGSVAATTVNIPTVTFLYA